MITKTVPWPCETTLKRDKCFHCLTQKSPNIYFFFSYIRIYCGLIIKQKEVRTKIQQHSSGVMSAEMPEQKEKKKQE